MGELLLEDPRVPERQDEVVPRTRLLRAARHLLALINDILDLSKIEAGKMELHLEVFAIAPLLDEVASTMRPPTEANGRAPRTRGRYARTRCGSGRRCSTLPATP